jgi:hypothetical protein
LTGFGGIAEAFTEEKNRDISVYPGIDIDVSDVLVCTQRLTTGELDRSIKRYQEIERS